MARAAERAWQRMLSGRRLDMLDPSPVDVELSDIAHGLARVARWNGQTSGDYSFSVAQHSVLVLEIFRALAPEADVRAQLYALLHDAPEYVMGDIISPFKAAMGGNYKEVENRLLGAIHLHFALNAMPPAALQKQIKRADQRSRLPRGRAPRRLRGRRSAQILRRTEPCRLRPRAFRRTHPPLARPAKRTTASSTPSTCWRRRWRGARAAPHALVIPAQAGIQTEPEDIRTAPLDPRLRGDDSAFPRTPKTSITVKLT